MRLSVLIPVYNERGTIEAMVERLMTVAKPYKIIVVDDGSNDGSQQIVRQLQDKYPEVLRRALHPRNLGKAAALRTALAQARGDIVMIQDADLECHPEDYPAALRLIDQGVCGRGLWLPVLGSPSHLPILALRGQPVSDVHLQSHYV